jgi:hypothetical protein
LWWTARIIVRHGRLIGKICREDTADIEEMGLQKRNLGHNEAYVVDGCRYTGTIVTGRTRVQGKPHCEKEMAIYSLRDFCGISGGIEAPEIVAEIGGKGGIVLGRNAGHHNEIFTGIGIDVLQNGCGCFIVDGNGRIHE